jgi:hypothetical protein
MNKLTLIKLLVLSLLAQYSLSCSCANISLEDAVANTDKIFLARALSGAPINSTQNRFLFYVYKSYKGAVYQQQYVRSNKVSAICGRSFTVGKLYVVFANIFEGTLVTTLCDKTQIATSEFIQQIKDILAAEDNAIAVKGGKTSGKTGAKGTVVASKN